MGKELLTKKEIKFVENGKKWNFHFEMGFLVLWIATVALPFIFVTDAHASGLRKIFEDASFYSSAILIGLLITVVNQRWIRIVKKLMK